MTAYIVAGVALVLTAPVWGAMLIAVADAFCEVWRDIAGAISEKFR